MCGVGWVVAVRRMFYESVFVDSLSLVFICVCGITRTGC